MASNHLWHEYWNWRSEEDAEQSKKEKENMVINWKLTNFKLPHVPGQAVELSRGVDLPDGYLSLYLGPFGKPIQADVIFVDESPWSVENYGNCTIKLWRRKDSTVSRVIFDDILTDPAKVQDWVNLIQTHADGPLLGAVSATVLTLWTHVAQLFDKSKSRFWLTPSFPGGTEFWLSHGYKFEEEQTS